MSNEEILERAISRAIDGGLDWLMWDGYIGIRRFNSNEVVIITSRMTFNMSIRDIIFNHDFAKALWGEETCDYDQSGNKFVDEWGWDHYLQQMVIADDPIKYLGDNL